MNARQFLLAILLTGTSFGVLWFVLGREQPIALIDVEDGPRVPVAPDEQTKALVLTGIADKIQARGNALRTIRNDLAREHKEAIGQWRAGQVPLREVERIEQLLWVARQGVGEIGEAEMHRQLAGLFERERERLEILHKRGLAGEDQLQRAALYVARERFLAGEPVADALGRDYDAMRREYLDNFRRTHETLIKAGLGHREQLKLDLMKLAEDFPAVTSQAR